MKKCKSKEELIFNFEVLEEDTKVRNRVDIQEGEKGDYVVQFPNGSFLVISEDFFKDTFEIVERKSKTYLEILEEFMDNNKSDYAKNLWIRKEISDISILLGNYGLSDLRERFLEKIALKYNIIEKLKESGNNE